MWKILWFFMCLHVALGDIMYNSDGSRVYHRIPKYLVNETVAYFIEAQEIHDCFHFVINDFELSLKCLRNGELYNVDIHIYKSNRNRNTISI